MLKARDLAVKGLTPFDIDLDAGTCVALSGPSGAGKTLILRALADLDPAAGSVTIEGVSRDAMPATTWRRRVGYVAAEPGWWRETIGEHFDEPDSATALFPALNLPLDLFDQTVATASTGERQRLALIRTLLLAPSVLLLDEPTSGLDAESAQCVESLLTARLSGGTAILLVSHDSALAARMAERRLTIADGRVVAA